MKSVFHVFLRLFAKIFAEQISKTTFSASLGLAMSLSLAATTAAFAKTIDLSTVEPTFDNVIQVGDGDVLTGTLDGSERAYKVVIAAGATVTLENATIKGYEGRNHVNSWAGINCEGKCNIYLAEGSKNFVTGFDLSPAIYVPQGSTLTIDGNGELKVETDGVGAGIGGGSITGSMANCGSIVINGGSIHAKSYFGAGIGSGGSNADCDGITINGGTIVVESGYGAGIGSGRESKCGNIVINGGSVTASVQYIGAGIGCGYNGSCGDITISANVTKISVTKGTQAFSYSIGVNGRGSVGKITIGGEETGNISKSPYVYPSDDAYMVVFSKNDGSGTVKKQIISYDLEETLNSNSFVRDGFGFACWNTKADGSGVTYLDGATVLNIANAGETVTLYAQWFDGDISILRSDYVIQNKTVLTGTLMGNYKISIAENATVTLNNVTINGKDKEEYNWAGITCLGNCTIVLADGSTNIVKGFASTYPGVQASNKGTLTIQGNDGKLYASSNGNAAGIGGGYNIGCGNIEINGGTIVATGGRYAPGIGGGYRKNVGYIKISGSDTKVTAIKGEDAPYSIGEGLDGSRTGTITIGDVVTASIVGSPFKYPVVQYTVTFDANGGNGTMSNQSTNIDLELTLEANSFTREGYSFIGWNTEVDGSGISYADQGRVNFAEVGSSIKLYAQWSKGDVVNLATLKDNYTAKDGDVLTGALGGNYKISIEKNATVTLNNVVINGVHEYDYRWAGITCLGDCEIVLAENSKNAVKGFYRDYPGINVPEGKTLTISGTGSLDASSNGYAAGIGGGYNLGCGNIEINGGTVVATGGRYAPGIGGGYRKTVGYIKISGNDTKVTAIKGEDAPYSIGEGNSGSRTGDITIGDVVTASIVGSPFKYPVVQYTVTFDANGGNGTMSNQSINIDPELILEANSYTREGYSFVGWNTEADGSGVSYENQNNVNFAEVGESITLYAQWLEGNVINLAALTGNYVAQNGVELTGMLGGNYKISIEENATVTLNNVIIDGVSNYNYKWAGITCLGNCNIILEGENTVKGFYHTYPGIYVPVEKTLTISGIGSLDASSNGSGAGIGGGDYIDGGNIVIDGGTVFATGGKYAAGIGSGQEGTIGNISINGGIVSAMGGREAAGIGGGAEGVVGNITITDNVTKVTATKDEEAPYSIGRGDYSSRTGDITIGGVAYDNIAESPFVYPAAVTQYAAVQIRGYNSGTRAVIDGEYDGTDAVNIPKDTAVASVVFNRKFLKNIYSTMVLPFSVKTEKVSGLNAVLYYNGIGKDKNGENAVKMKVLWAADGVINDDKGNPVFYKDTVMKANTPYLVLMGSETFAVEGPVTIVPTAEAVTSYENCDWEFRGTWQYKKWGAKGSDPETGFAYGFAASSSEDNNINVGDFVKVGEGAWIRSMRAYLVKAGISEKASFARANGAYVMRPTVAQTELPELMSIIVDNGDGDDNNAEHTTIIGHFNTRTGEIQMIYDRGMFDLKGRRVNGANNARGAYYGKKVLKK